MKKRTRWLCFFLVVSLLVVIPVQASTTADSRASSYFFSYAVHLQKTTTNSFRIWFEVDAISLMDELGASTIHVYRSEDGDTWTKVRTYSSANYSNMICENTISHADYVTYTGAWTGYYYKAAITLYAKNSTGSTTSVKYTEIIKMQ